VELVITIEAFGPEHKEKIMEVLKEKGYRPLDKSPKAVL
jgi:threonine dehydratase